MDESFVCFVNGVKWLLVSSFRDLCYRHLTVFYPLVSYLKMGPVFGKANTQFQITLELHSWKFSCEIWRPLRLHSSVSVGYASIFRFSLKGLPPAVLLSNTVASSSLITLMRSPLCSFFTRICVLSDAVIPLWVPSWDFSFGYLQPVVGRIPSPSCWVIFISWMWVPTWVLSIISDSDLFTYFYLCSFSREMTPNSLDILIFPLPPPYAHIHTPLFLSLLCLGEEWGVQAHVGGDLSLLAANSVKSTSSSLLSSPPRFCRLPKRGSGGAHL